MKEQIEYRDGYKYQLARDYVIKTTIKPRANIDTEFIRLQTDGTLLIRRGYAWDGPSGPTIDSPSSMRAALVHDALYQLMREEWLGQECRPIADDLFYEILIADGMWKPRAWFWRREVRKFAGFAANPKNEKPVRIAP